MYQQLGGALVEWRELPHELAKKMNKPEPAKSSKSQKKQYVSPQLVEYGTVSKLTQGTGTYNGDAGQLMMTML